MATCGCCGALLPEGRAYTCNDRCEAAQNRDIEAYLRASDANRYDFERPTGDGDIISDTRSSAFEVAAAIARVHVGVPDNWRRR